MKTETTGRIWAEDPATGKRRDLTFEEHRGVLDLGNGRGAAAHRHPDRGTDRAVPPQPHPVPAAGHRRADPAAADRPVQDRRRAPAGHLHPSSPTCCRRSCAGSAATGPDVPLVVVLRQERARLQPADAAAVPVPPPARGPARRPRRRCADYLDHALDRDRGQRRRRPAAALHLPRLPPDLHHRRDPARDAAAHRPARRRAPRHQHHHGLQGRLPRGGHQRPPRVHHPPPGRCGPQRSTASRPTRNGPSSSATSSAARSPSATAAAPTPPPASTSTAACAARCCAPTPPSVPAWSRSAATSSTASPKPSKPGWLGEAEGLRVSLAGASEQARPDGPDHRPPQHHHQPRHASLRRRRRPHSHHPGKPPAGTATFHDHFLVRRRPGRLGLARQDHRAGHDRLQLRAA